MRFAIILTLCLVGVASAGSLNKRFIDEDFLKKHFSKEAEEMKANFEKLREALLNRFQNNDVSGEVIVEKRELREVFDRFSKFAQTKTQEAYSNVRRLIDNLFKKNPFLNNDDEDTTEHPIVKRNIIQELERMNSKAQAQAQKVFNSLQRAFSSIFMPFKPNRGNDNSEDSTERSVSKRDIFEHFSRFNQKVQNQAQKAFNELKRVFNDLFKNNPEAEIEIESEAEVTTERIVKRDIFDFFGKLNEKAQEEAAKVFEKLEKKFGNLFNHHDDDEEDDDDDDEDSTEISIEKRDIFDFFGEMNEKIQDQAAKFFNKFNKPSSKPEIDEDSTEISIEKRDIFDFFGEMNERIQDQAAKVFNQFHKPGPKHGPKPGPKHGPKHGLKPVPKPEDVVEEVEVVTSA